MIAVQPVAEVAFAHDGLSYVALVYADEVAFDLYVYRRELVRRVVRGEVKLGVLCHWVADGYLVWGEWRRDAGDRRVWRVAKAAIERWKP